MPDEEKGGGLPARVYSDVASPATKEVGNVVARAVRVALLPVNGTLWSIEQATDWVVRAVRERFDARSVPDEDVIPPTPAVLGSVIVGVQSTGGEPQLAAMFADLLATAMDATWTSTAHRAFAEIIRQLEPNEARLLAYIHSHASYVLVPGGRLRAGAIALDSRQLRVTDPMKLAVDAGYDPPPGRIDLFGNVARLGLVAISEQGSAYPNSEAGTLAITVEVTGFGEQFFAACFPRSAASERVPSEEV